MKSRMQDAPDAEEKAVFFVTEFTFNPLVSIVWYKCFTYCKKILSTSIRFDSF